MQKNKPIPVYLLTGFLGAGKTTLLNSLLQQSQAYRNIVIENEFGKVNIDASLVTAQIENVYELTNGCICCSLDNELLEVLGNILRLKELPDQLFIETTGIADAGNIIGMFSIPDVKARYQLVSTICVVDAENVETRLEQVTEVGKQVSCADVIILNKTTDLPVPEQVRLQQLLENINPFAYITATADGQVPIGDVRPSERRMPAVAADPAVKTPHKINTVLFESPRPFDLQMLVFVLEMHFNVYTDQLYRIKGYVAVKDDPEKYLVQSTGNYLSIVPAGNWEDTPPVSTLVFIGKELKSATIQRILQPALR
ncbi:CobW family GTP-binding protein [Chitinophaga qingshengii]|uniref:GTP-binding protein n=1 Tax=Chitinophaga qingshengii TaxID=1569794 RepID=A0ABR7TXS8_9BACT|nr:GTP-binding protein [Chitinophaga qingshengii]MBC9934259.1 GTP-binding protein [Chitinophaga qingshengii]